MILTMNKEKYHPWNNNCSWVFCRLRRIVCLNENYLAIYTDNIKNIITVIKSEKTSITEIELYNILGSKIQQWNPKNNDNINVKINQQLPIGIYIVKLKTSNGEISKKIFIE